MAVAFQFDPIETGFLHAFRGIGIVRDDARDIPILDQFRGGTMRRFTFTRGGNGRQPVALGPAGSAAEMRQLDHHRTAMAVHLVGQFAHPADDLVFPGEYVVEGGRAVTRDRGGTCRHRQRDTGFRALDVIGAVARLRHAVFRVGRFMAGRHDPVFQRQMLQLIGLQQRIADFSHQSGLVQS